MCPPRRRRRGRRSARTRLRIEPGRGIPVTGSPLPGSLRLAGLAQMIRPAGVISYPACMSAAIWAIVGIFAAGGFLIDVALVLVLLELLQLRERLNRELADVLERPH